MSTTRKMKWLDFSAHNSYLIPTKLASGRFVLLMVGNFDEQQQLEGLNALEFKKLNDTTYFSVKFSNANGSYSGITLNAFREYWPEVKVVEKSIDEIYRPFQFLNNVAGNSATSQNQNQNFGKQGQSAISQKVQNKIKTQVNPKASIVESNQAEFLGLNHLNEKVFNGVDGRFVESDGETYHFDDIGVTDPSRFLHSVALVQTTVPNVEIANLKECAKGLVLELVEGSSISFDELKRRACIWFDATQDQLDNRPGKSLSLYLMMQRAIEAEIASVSRNLYTSRPDFEIDYYVNKFNELHSRRPVVPRNEILEITSKLHMPSSQELPPCFAKVVGDFASNLEHDATLSVPFVSSGSNLVFLRDDLKVKAISNANEVGICRSGIPEHLQGVAQFSKSDLSESGVAAESVDASVIFPPTGQLAQLTQVDGIWVQRYDHKLGIELLRGIKNDGKALLVVSGDGINSIGNVSRDSADFHNFIYQNYEVSSCVDCDGQLSNSSSNDTYRVYVISGRRLQLSKEPAPTEIPYFHSATELMKWSENFSEMVIRPSTETLGLDVLDEEIRINDFQSRYLPQSKLGEATSMVPKNLAVPLRMGFAKLLNDHPDVDAFVSNRLKMPLEQLKRVFSVEQIDVIALAIWRNEKNLGFLNGDQTGEGKGRVHAALLRYHVLSGKKAMFFSNKSSLFQDIWRDICAIESEDLFNPFIVNEKQTIEKSDGTVISANPRELNRLVESNTYPDDCNLILATYTQINRQYKTITKTNGQKIRQPNKADWLTNLAKGQFVSIDEAHHAAGSSVINKRMTALLRNASNILYGSATWARTQKNYGIYFALLRGIEPSQIEKAVMKGGDVLQEIFSASLAADGAFIRREKDIARATVRALSNQEKLPENVVLNDAFAEILQGIAMLSGEIDKVVNKSNSDLVAKLEAQHKATNPNYKVKLSEVGLNTTGFASTLFNLSKQFILSLNSDFAADVAIEALKKNQKPFIGFEFTGSSFLSLMYDRQTQLIKEGKATDYRFEGKLQFKHLLHQVLDRILHISQSGKIAKLPYSSLISGQSLQAFEQSLAALRESIDNFPDFHYMPLDHLRHRLNEANFSVAELSGRTIRIDKVGPNEYEMVKIAPNDKNGVISAFNSGELDVVLGGKSACDGLSAHADVTFKDQRQRVLIELEVQRNVSDRVQLLGRVDRRGQVCSPELISLSCALPLQERFNAMSNAALMKMSANVTSNRDSSMYLKTVNLLNEEGDYICHKYLEANPQLIHQLAMKMEDVYVENITKSSINSLSRKLTGRLSMLSFEDQNKVYDDLAREYLARINDLNNRGLNPFKPKHLDLKAIEVSRAIYKGVSRTHYQSEFDKPIYLKEITYQETVSPWTGEQVLEKVEKEAEWLKKDSRLGGRTDLAYIADSLKSNRMKMLVDCAEGDKTIVDDVLKDISNRVYAYNTKTEYTPLPWSYQTDMITKTVNRLDYLINTLPKLKIGTVISLPSTFYNDFDIKGECVVTSIRLPQPGSEHNPSQYSFKIIAPGDSIEMEIALDQFYNRQDLEFFQNELFSDDHDLFDEFDYHKPGSRKRDALLLEGNLFLAALEATEEGLGSPVTYTTEDGQEQRAIMLRHDLTKNEMLFRPVPIHKWKVAADYLRDYPSHYLENTRKRDDKNFMSLRVSQSSDRYVLTLPQAAKRYKVFTESSALKAALHDRPFTITRNSATVDVFEDELNDAMAALYSHGVVFQTQEQGLSWLNDYEANGKQIVSPLQNPASSRTNSISKKIA
ncbi:strawberry notch C-terminal domain-containing protein [Shewanella marisflavi]|uniref:strawberry notch C-terminal domain-containing protein n=1 Tax=Shewanella marisflavi TaxID=260364 RepID=UPI003AB0598B